MWLHISCMDKRRSVSLEMVVTFGIGAGMMDVGCEAISCLIYWAEWLRVVVRSLIICLTSVHLVFAFSESVILQCREELSRSILELCKIESVDL